MLNTPSTHHRKHVSKARAYKHANTPSTQARKNASTLNTSARKHVKHASMQVRKHAKYISTQARKHAKHASTPSTRFSRLFFFSAKKAQGFSSDRKILILLLSVLFHLQNQVSVFSQHI